MEQPEGYEEDNKVCRLQRSLYGLRQAGRVWFETLIAGLKTLGLTEFQADRCCFFMRRENQILLMTIYVDDFLIFTNSAELQTEVIANLGQIFPLKDLGPARYCLGIKITQRPEERIILLDQKESISRILDRFGMAESKPVPTPLDIGTKLTKRAENEGGTDAPYREAVGCLIHVSQTTRPDICHAVGVVSQFSSDPTTTHWTAVKRILRYLKGTIDLQLKYDGRGGSSIEGYCDADWGGCLESRRSTTGYAFLVSGGCVSWASKRQPTVALSSTEAEYMACAAACQEIKWLLNFEALPSIPIVPPLALWCDNQGAVLLSLNGIQHQRTKHIDLRHHFIRDMVEENLVIIKHIGSSDQVADIMTKCLSPEKFRACRGKLGLC